MKTQFRKKRFRQKKKVAVVIIIIGLFFLLNLYQKETKNFFYSFFLPFQKYFWEKGISVSRFFSSVFLDKSELKRENEELKRKIEKLSAEKVNLLDLKKENQVLKKALDMELEKKYQLVLVQIIGKGLGEESLLIDKGRENGILEGQPVITAQNTLVGRVVEVYKNFSKVLLVSSKKSSFDGKIIPKEEGLEEREEVFGLVKGEGAKEIIFDLVPKEKCVKEGDLVVTSGKSGIFPPGILVGEVKSVENLDIQPFQKVRVRPIFDIKKEVYLFIITNFKQ